jgi:hypothetical protein
MGGRSSFHWYIALSGSCLALAMTSLMGRMTVNMPHGFQFRQLV